MCTLIQQQHRKVSSTGTCISGLAAEFSMIHDPSNAQIPSTAFASAPTLMPVGESHTSGNPPCEAMDIASPPPEEQKPRQRKCTSSVWADFKRETKPDGSVTATCNHCNEKLTVEA